MLHTPEPHRGQRDGPRTSETSPRRVCRLSVHAPDRSVAWVAGDRDERSCTQTPKGRMRERHTRGTVASRAERPAAGGDLDFPRSVCPAKVKRVRPHCTLHPHPGGVVRMCGCNAAAVRQERKRHTHAHEDTIHRKMRPAAAALPRNRRPTSMQHLHHLDGGKAGAFGSSLTADHVTRPCSAGAPRSTPPTCTSPSKTRDPASVPLRPPAPPPPLLLPTPPALSPLPPPTFIPQTAAMKDEADVLQLLEKTALSAVHAVLDISDA